MEVPIRAKTCSQNSLSSSLVFQSRAASLLETGTGADDEADAKHLTLHRGCLSRGAEAQSEDSPALYARIMLNIYMLQKRVMM